MSPALLSSEVDQVLIVAYQEDTRQLETFFFEQGFACEVLRQSHRPEHVNFSPSYLCLLNHCDAWKIAATRDRPTLIIEADFVPVRNLGSLPVPYDPQQPNVALAWLYTCAPQIYSVTEAGHAVGFSTAMVAYLVTPRGALRLQALAAQIARDPGPTQYSSWDSTIEEFMRKQGLTCYVPWRNYGEHGGKPNLEHKQAGLCPTHRADVLYGPLAFQPLYAEAFQQHQFGMMLTRLKARVKGTARLLLGKYLRWKVLSASSTPLRLCRFAASRHLTRML